MMQGKIIKVEERAIGSVKRSVYWAYIRAWGALWLPLTLIAAAFIERGVAVSQNYWLKVQLPTLGKLYFPYSLPKQYLP